jgi:hypothetical protein
MKIFNLIKIMKIFDLIKTMKIFNLIKTMKIFNLIKTMKIFNLIKKMKIFNLIQIMKIFNLKRREKEIFDLIKKMKIYHLIQIMKIINLIKIFQPVETNSKFGFHTLENPVPTRSVRGPLTRSFTIGNGSGRRFSDVSGDDRIEQVTVRSERVNLMTKTWTIFVNKTRNSRASKFTSPFPLVRYLVTRSVREQTYAKGNGRIERDVELVVTPLACSSQKKWEQIAYWERDVRLPRKSN